MSNPEVKLIVVQISPPTSGSPQGVTADGAYIVANGKVTLTDREGKIIRGPDGKNYSQKLNEGDNPRQIAGRLTKSFRSVLRGDSRPGYISRPIDYPRNYWKYVV